MLRSKRLNALLVSTRKRMSGFRPTSACLNALEAPGCFCGLLTGAAWLRTGTRLNALEAPDCFAGASRQQGGAVVGRR